jgi:hypothetical protein
MVSKTNSPANLSSAWSRYTVPLGTTVSGKAGWFDYPGLGVSPQAIVVTGNIFSESPISFLGTKIRVFDRTELYDGDAEITYKDINNDTSKGFTIQPAIHLGAPPAGAFYLLQRASATALRVWMLTGLPGAPASSTALVTTGNQGNCVFSAPQKGTSKGLDTVCERMMNAVWRAGSLWGTLTGSDPSGSRAIVQWFEVKTSSSGSPALLQHGTVDGGAGEFTFVPSIAVDFCGNAALVYTQSSSSRYPEMRYTGRGAGDTPRTMRPAIVAKTSAGFYDDFSGPNRERWGDYSAAVIDPAGTSFWIAQEYVKVAAVVGDDGHWGTWHTRFSFGCSVLPLTGVPVYLPIAQRK